MRPPTVCRELRSLHSSAGLAVECLDGSLTFYRIEDGRLERTDGQEREWTELSPQDILQHLVLHTPVAAWLENRVVLRPAEWVKDYFHTE